RDASSRKSKPSCSIAACHSAIEPSRRSDITKISINMTRPPPPPPPNPPPRGSFCTEPGTKANTKKYARQGPDPEGGTRETSQPRRDSMSPSFSATAFGLEMGLSMNVSHRCRVRALATAQVIAQVITQVIAQVITQVITQVIALAGTGLALAQELSLLEGFGD